MKCLFFGIMSLVASLGYAQNVLNAISPEELREQRANKTKVTEAGDTVSTLAEPLPYGYIEDKEVIWSKVVWEVIDLNERLNQPYYRSSDGLLTESATLFDALAKGVESGEIAEVYDDEYFQNKMTYQQIRDRMVNVDTQQFYYDMVEAGETPDEGAIFNFEMDSQDIKMVKIKGIWYIDRRLGEMKYRLLGLCIMGPDAQTLGTEFDDGQYVELFWIWYPSARKTLNNYNVFNPNNSSSSITFDDLLNARRFSSVIYKAQTMYGIRPIEDYIPRNSKGQLEEHDRIRESILQSEADMWHY
ncbi:type IX secretion system ring subunit PorN/GldN [Moheibacter sediminis]|uniref:Gliding motility associated protien GldN n=1 Tax=Moheibacter sediminis TaxID=1434700 RepID=A0A1W1ZTH7_9FLAO|nr:gliding motility protein GldN [Moheibacter sediminis]SMC51666.1 gliding motility associated protien GldN [Moheibacter sediminis]